MLYMKIFIFLNLGEETTYASKVAKYIYLKLGTSIAISEILLL